MSVRTFQKTLSITVGFAVVASALSFAGSWVIDDDHVHAFKHGILVFSTGILLSPFLIFPLVRKTHLLLEAQCQLTKLANTDALTGLPNRRAFYDAAQELMKAGRVTTILLDIDRFKRLNDTFGHAVGDEVLRAVAARIEECLRGHDTSSLCHGRVGGEEFAVLVSGCKAADADRICADLAETIRSAPIAAGGRQHAITVSIGYDYREECSDLDDAMRKADDALYAAKTSGRDQVSSSDRPELSPSQDAA